MADGKHFAKMADQKTCGRDILWNLAWIACKFDLVVLWVFLMIRLTFGENPTEDILKKSHLKSLWARYLINRWLDHIYILCSGSVGICNVSIDFYE